MNQWALLRRAGHCERSLNQKPVLTITGWLAGASTDVVRHHSGQIVDDLLRLERGELPLHVANPEVFDS
jgi:hypothetical protein